MRLDKRGVKFRGWLYTCLDRHYSHSFYYLFDHTYDASEHARLLYPGSETFICTRVIYYEADVIAFTDKGAIVEGYTVPRYASCEMVNVKS